MTITDTSPSATGPAPAADDPAVVPYAYGPTRPLASAMAAAEQVSDESSSPTAMTVAGRIVTRRQHANVAFLVLRDASGEGQVLVEPPRCDRADDLLELPIGSWVGVTSTPTRTRRGSPALEAAQWQLLARCRVPWTDPRAGLADRDERYRRRYLDLWANPDSAARFRQRSRIVSGIRRFLDERGFLEVETPILSDVASGASARPFVTHHHALDRELHLRVAPELYLKRLVAGGFERVFELGRSFRNEGVSTRHNPEFTMIEVYQAFADWQDMMRLTEDLISSLVASLLPSPVVEVDGRPVDLSTPFRRATMAELVSGAVGTPVDVSSPATQLADLLRSAGGEPDPTWTSGRLLYALYDHLVEPTLWEPTFVTEHPVETSPLARAHRSVPGVTERFELLIAGRELANAFSELCDPVEQRARFVEQAAMAAGGDDEAMAIDEDYLEALELGLPPTGGLGIGIDRLVMLLTEATSIRDVIFFPSLRVRS